MVTYVTANLLPAAVGLVCFYVGITILVTVTLSHTNNHGVQVTSQPLRFDSTPLERREMVTYVTTRIHPAATGAPAGVTWVTFKIHPAAHPGYIAELVWFYVRDPPSWWRRFFQNGSLLGMGTTEHADDFVECSHHTEAPPNMLLEASKGCCRLSIR